ncbi:MAG: alpha-D-ribose 1-methylphosphonate 5-triphosphate diphosphatase [Parvibaculaceae bacterium]
MTSLVIRGGKVLLAGAGLVAAAIRIEAGDIVAIADHMLEDGAAVIDAEGAIVLPGIVDIHGDAFERQILPRPQARFPLDLAFMETDRQLAANGITTAYHGITVSWEPGLRSLATARDIVAMLDALDAHLAADHRLHIRWETFAHEEMATVAQWLARARKPLLAFNDHTAPSLNGNRKASKIKASADRAAVTAEEYGALLAHAARRRDAVPAAIEHMAGVARANGVAMLSHDDMTAGERRFYRGLGAGIAEFPMTEEAIASAGEAGDPIVLGAPNVVRGGSHNGAIDATAAVVAGRCTILASDYYYPALLHAAFRLVAKGHLPLAEAWALVSRNPAEACGLDDRGSLAVGKRADVLVISAGKGELPTVRTTIASGRVIYASSLRN